ncbi:MAG: hypothetical protein IJK60_06655 [Clostridia bacterium]|nr:hypothetical protein [Clostridia bacterium]
MIEFTPGTLDENGVFTYTASGENANAVCKAKLEGAKVTLLSITGADDDSFVTEGLVRSALNYGANRNAYTAYAAPECFDKRVIAVLQTLGFENEKEMLVCDIPDALTGGCRRCK